MTYQNVILYSHATPSFDNEREEQEDSGYRPEIDAGDPNNKQFNVGIVTSIH